MMYDAMIIGGGASGLAAACALAGAGKKVLLAEKQSRVGRKLLSTGNGRCNLTNLRAVPQNYHGARAAAARALELCPPKDVLGFFEELGLPAVSDEEGRVYPMSNQAASVLDALRLSAAERGCEIVTDCAAESVQRGKNGFSVRCSEGRTFQAKKVLVCTGGLAAPKLGACGDGYKMLESLGHASVPKLPAIAALKTPPEQVRALKGQRVECLISLLADGKTLREERGEVLFSETGVSGIASMQLARACGEALKAGKKCAVRINIVGDGDAFDMLCDRVEKLPKRAMEDFLNGIVSKRVGMALVKLAGVEMTRPAESLKTKELRALADVLTGWTIPVTGVQGFEQAQVTAGGISLKDFDWDTMESKRVPGLYAAGEVLDVDGDCGGFNLQWAWASALIAAKAMMRD